MVLIKFREKISFVELGLVFQFGSAMFLCGLLFLNISGGVYKNSTKLVSTLQKRNGFEEEEGGMNKKVSRRMVQSLHEFGVGCGPTKAFTYNSMLEFFILVASGVTTILVNLSGRGH